jgi:hypothetical protein
MLLLTVRIPFSRSEFFNDLARCEKSPCNTVICAIFVLLQNFLGTIKNLADFDERFITFFFKTLSENCV